MLNREFDPEFSEVHEASGCSKEEFEFEPHHWGFNLPMSGVRFYGWFISRRQSASDDISRTVNPRISKN